MVFKPELDKAPVRVARDTLQSGNGVARFETALREVLGQHINRDTLDRERGDVVGNLWRLRLIPSCACRQGLKSAPRWSTSQ